ncbi:hypothetical protein [Endozoicomonas ascidiicola]|uniref:hypothetical protein n=1 Tax=Endozoicomonas ascidiicola TaxID=1698521 RepID=UPI0012FB22B1|nr:hypothetical protein [Endozoicomonas ascidiicola]
MAHSKEPLTTTLDSTQTASCLLFFSTMPLLIDLNICHQNDILDYFNDSGMPADKDFNQIKKTLSLKSIKETLADCPDSVKNNIYIEKINALLFTQKNTHQLKPSIFEGINEKSTFIDFLNMKMSFLVKQDMETLFDKVTKKQQSSTRPETEESSKPQKADKKDNTDSKTAPDAGCN